MKRLVEIWNRLPGGEPVARFTADIKLNLKLDTTHRQRPYKTIS
jgi:hypothetical protein